MPPTTVHFNGSINLPDTDTVFATLGAQIGELALAYPDGETDDAYTKDDITGGNRRNWIWFQVAALENALGLTRIEDANFFGDAFPQFAPVEPNVDPEFPDGSLLYADVYLDSYRRFLDAKEQGDIPQGTLFQVQYPTPAAVGMFFAAPHREYLVGLYQPALIRDLQSFLERVDTTDIQVQWDVAAEFGLLESWYGQPKTSPEDVAETLIPLAEAVPVDVPVGFHLCYGDYKHRHLSEPADLGTQVDLINAIEAGTGRFVDFYSITVPQDRSDEEFFQPLERLVTGAELFFGIVPYRPEDQGELVTQEQVDAIDTFLEDENWGICTECGLGRVENEERARELIALHRDIVLRFGIERD